jgi:hypothetical protein
MTTIALPLGTLIWTPDAPRPIETLQAGDTLIGFNPDTFSRVPVLLQRVQVQEQVPTRRLEVGGRVVTIAENQPCTLFRLDGNWQTLPAPELQQGDFLPVDRLIPVPAHPIALPPLDKDLTARLDEDALALSDALYNSAAYFREMEKRELRLALYELSGAFCEIADFDGSFIDFAPAHKESMDYYNTLSRRIFGMDMWDAALIPRWIRWMGDGHWTPVIRSLPIWVWNLPTPAVSAFLRGYFDNGGHFTDEKISTTYDSLKVLVGLQTLLGRLHIESTLQDEGRGFPCLTIRNVRRYAEWVNSSVPEHAGILKAVYTREPRYPSDSTAHLPLNVIRPALERIRNRHALPALTSDKVDEQEATRLETLRLLATAFHDAELRDAVNQQLYLEPITANVTAHLDTLFILSITSPATIIANGVIVGGTPTTPK